MRDETITSNAGEALICEYVNVADAINGQKTKWERKWGELLDDTLYLYPNKIPNTQFQHKFKIKGCEIHPAVKETGRLLAFKIANNDKIIITIEPLNIKDMGRWISSLFASIQGIYSSNNLKTDLQKSTDSSQNFTKKIHNNISEEKMDFIVNVRSLAQKFEKLSSTETPNTPNITRSHSSPNLRSVLRRGRDNEDSKGVATRSEASANEESVQNTELSQEKKGNTVRSWRGSYIAQHEEKTVLSNVNNSTLAKEKLVKQEQQVQRLEVTVRSIIERVERQKRALEETNTALQKFKSQATGPEDEKEIAALDDQRMNLQKQIAQSEQNIADYRDSIQGIEQDMINISKLISNDRGEPEVDKHEDAKSDPKTPTAKTSENGVRDHADAASESESEEEIGMDKPAWAREAQRKSRKAAKNLAKRGILT